MTPQKEQNVRERLREATTRAVLVRRLGAVRQLNGLAIEAHGPDATVGEVCKITGRNQSRAVLAEVVGLRSDGVTLMPYGTVDGLAVGSVVEATGDVARIGVGRSLLGRVVDGFGSALDGRIPPSGLALRPVKGDATNPLLRPRITRVLETGIRTIDTMLPLGQGQRVGIFSGSGIGKSTLLGMIARHVKADVNVIALIGERGREVREFIDKQLGADG